MTTNYYYGSTHIFTNNSGEDEILLDSVGGTLTIDGFDPDSVAGILVNDTGITISNKFIVQSTLTGTSTSLASTSIDNLYTTTGSISGSINNTNASITTLLCTTGNLTTCSLTNITTTSLSATSSTITSSTITNATITNTTVTNLRFTTCNNLVSTNTNTNTLSGNLIISGTTTYNPYYGLLGSGTSQTFNNGDNLELTCFSSFTTNGMTNASTSRITVPVAGYYLLSYSISFSSMFLFEGTYLYAMINGVEKIGLECVNGSIISATHMSGTSVIKLSANDYVSLGFKITFNSEVYGIYFSLIKLF